jgi:hypothetical protein
MKKLCILILAGSSLLFAADEPSDGTFGLENGRLWKTLRPDYRDMYIRGIFHGWVLRGDTEDTVMGKVINAMTASGNFRSNDLADMLTSIYADSENVALPIGWVVLASLAVERGEADRSTVLAALRKQMATLSAKMGRPGSTPA